MKVFKICPKCVQKMSKMCPYLQCVQIMSERCPSDVQKVSKFVGCVQNMSKPGSYFGHFLDTFQKKEILQQNVQKVSKRCPKGVQMFGHILDKSSGKIVGTSIHQQSL